jgi:hypothetical protein
MEPCDGAALGGNTVGHSASGESVNSLVGPVPLQKANHETFPAPSP